MPTLHEVFREVAAWVSGEIQRLDSTAPADSQFPNHLVAVNVTVDDVQSVDVAAAHLHRACRHPVHQRTVDAMWAAVLDAVRRERRRVTPASDQRTRTQSSNLTCLTYTMVAEQHLNTAMVALNEALTVEVRTGPSVCLGYYSLLPEPNEPFVYWARGGVNVCCVRDLACQQILRAPWRFERSSSALPPRHPLAPEVRFSEYVTRACSPIDNRFRTSSDSLSLSSDYDSDLLNSDEEDGSEEESNSEETSSSDIGDGGTARYAYTRDGRRWRIVGEAGGAETRRSSPGRNGADQRGGQERALRAVARGVMQAARNPAAWLERAGPVDGWPDHTPDLSPEVHRMIDTYGEFLPDESEDVGGSSSGGDEERDLLAEQQLQWTVNVMENGRRTVQRHVRTFLELLEDEDAWENEAEDSEEAHDSGVPRSYRPSAVPFFESTLDNGGDSESDDVDRAQDSNEDSDEGDDELDYGMQPLHGYDSDACNYDRMEVVTPTSLAEPQPLAFPDSPRALSPVLLARA